MYEMVTKEAYFVRGYPPGIKFVVEIGLVSNGTFFINVLEKRTLWLLRKMIMLINYE